MPSWLYMIDRGATTMWERWNGIDDDGTPFESLNHYSKGAVVSFLHRYVAGHPAARRRSRLPPLPGRAAARARASNGRARPTTARTAGSSPRGSFGRTGCLLTVEVPPGTTAELVLPDGPRRTVAPGRHTVSLVAS